MSSPSNKGQTEASNLSVQSTEKLASEEAGQSAHISETVQSREQTPDIETSNKTKLDEKEEDSATSKPSKSSHADDENTRDQLNALPVSATEDKKIADIASSSPSKVDEESSSKTKKPKAIYLPGSLVLAKLKGFPPWPAMVLTENLLPPHILKLKPKPSASSKRKSIGADEDDESRSAFPVRFFNDDNYMWATRSELKPLSKEQTSTYVNAHKGGKKDRSLLEAYMFAAEPPSMEEFAKMGSLPEEAPEEPVEEQMDDIQGAESTEMELQADVSDDKKKKPKKRKSAAPAEGNETPAQKRKKKDDTNGSAKKVAISTSSTNGESGSANKKSKKGSKEVKDTKEQMEGTEMKEAKEKEKDEGTEKPKEEKKGKKEKGKEKSKSKDRESTPAKKKSGPSLKETIEERTKHVLFLRHRLQKAFLTRDKSPAEEDMETMHKLLSKLEGFQGLELSIIRSTKINKVLKGINRLSYIPRDNEFHFKERCQKVLEGWNSLFDGNLSPAPQTNASAEHSIASAETEHEAKHEPVSNGLASNTSNGGSATEAKIVE
ncbi:hypothetical protein V1511DRAFT_487758 [Dipodascopsis uninucleata]